MTAFDLPPWIVFGYLFILGAVAGSFLSVCVHRLPRATSVWDGLRVISSPPSSCPKCGRRIPIRDNIPILGWLLLRGRCRDCGLRISIRYPLLELGNGLLWVALYWLEMPPKGYRFLAEAPLVSAFGPIASEHPLLSDLALVHARYAFHLLLLELLLVAALIDAATKTIPKVVTDPFIAVGLAASTIGGLYLLPLVVRPEGIAIDAASIWRAFADSDAPAWFARMFEGPPGPLWRFGIPGAMLHGFACSFAGAIAGAAPILFMRIAGRWIYGREAMGAGDVYLMALVGAFLGWQPAVASIAVASLIATAWFLAIMAIGARAEIPFGPFLAAGAATVLLAFRSLEQTLVAVAALGPLLIPLAATLAVLFVGLSLLMRLLLHPLLCRLPGYREDWYADAADGEWTAADQNQFFATSRLPEDRGLADRPDWSGESVSSGFSGEDGWRGG